MFVFLVIVGVQKTIAQRMALWEAEYLELRDMGWASEESLFLDSCLFFPCSPSCSKAGWIRMASLHGVTGATHPSPKQAVKNLPLFLCVRACHKEIFWVTASDSGPQHPHSRGVLQAPSRKECHAEKVRTKYRQALVSFPVQCITMRLLCFIQSHFHTTIHS